MKKGLLTIILCGLLFGVRAQVFNTSSVLGKGRFEVGFEPSLMVYDGSNEFNMFLHGGAGLGNGADLGMKVGVLGEETYLGGDVEFAINRNFSFSAGAHHFYEFGLDMTALLTLPVSSSASIVTGLDLDIVFEEEDTEIPVWLPLGVHVGVGNGWTFVMETGIKLSDVGYHFLGAGFNYRF
ncbi:MAG: hypothetical protein ACEPOZ_22065 [Marinifilaceae bacterium]|jgi:hypothetical protein